jgi:cytoskeletal protein CcmA (bactofilin family)
MLGKKSTDTKINTLIGAGAELSGDFTLDGSARIDGKIGGNVTVTGSLILGAGSVVTGEVQAASVLIGGEVTGNITAPEKAELTASAKVLGDIATKVIVIDEHAMLKDGKTYLEIAEKTGASTATISRVNRSLNYGNDGYELVFGRMEKKDVGK